MPVRKLRFKMFVHPKNTRLIFSLFIILKKDNWHLFSVNTTFIFLEYIPPVDRNKIFLFYDYFFIHILMPPSKSLIIMNYYSTIEEKQE